MRQGEAGQAASELDEILEVMEKREMDNKLHCGGEDAALVGEETWCGPGSNRAPISGRS